jgi:L-iditol 2-dehydrogenase
MGKYKVGVLTAERKVEIREFELRQPVGRQVLVKVDSCAICTMEQRVYQGIMKNYPLRVATRCPEPSALSVKRLRTCVRRQGGHADAQLLRRMLLLVEPEGKPVPYRVQELDTEGIAGPGGFSEYMMVDAVSVYRMAADIDLSHAALTEPLACCVHSIGQGDVRMGNDVVIIGSGIMALSISSSPGSRGPG